jgi:hypothetical protein
MFRQRPSELEYSFDLRLANRKLSGNAVPLLKDAIGEAQYQLIGEDHITREIPLFSENDDAEDRMTLRYNEAKFLQF